MLAAVQDVAPAALGQLDGVAVAADRGRREHLAAAQERDGARAGVERLVGARERGRRGARRSSSARVISHSLRVSSVGAAPARSASSARRRASQSTGRRLSGSTSESEASSSPW